MQPSESTSANDAIQPGRGRRVGAAVSTLSAQAPASRSREAAAAHEKHWGYEDSAESVGPAKWGTLAGDATCSTGKQQTPISLSTGAATPQDLPNLVFGYKPSSLSMINNGHTVQMTYEAGSTLGRVGGKDTWTLAQFHFHAPSEHTVDGTSYPLEMHLVHARRRREAGRRRRRLHPGRQGERRARAGVPEPARKGRRQGSPRGRNHRCRRAAAGRQDVFHLHGLADHAALHRGHHVVRAEDAD